MPARVHPRLPLPTWPHGGMLNAEALAELGLDLPPLWRCWTRARVSRFVPQRRSGWCPGRRYRYYISKRLMHGGKDETGWRLPARELERAVIGTLAAILRDEARLVEGLALTAAPGALRQMFRRAGAIAAALEDDQRPDRRSLLQQLVHRIVVTDDSLQLDLHRHALLQALGGDAAAPGASDPIYALHTPMRFARRGVEAKLVLGGSVRAAVPDRSLIAVVAQAHRWFEQLTTGEVGSIDQIAARERLDASDVGRQIRLAFLAPDIVEALLAGTQPVELSGWRLKRISHLPLDWTGQRRHLGFKA